MPGLRAACPHCAAVFLLTDEQLNTREGLVRCGTCDEIFNARWYLMGEEEEQESEQEQAESHGSSFEPELTAVEEARLDESSWAAMHDTEPTRDNPPKPEEFDELPETPAANPRDSRQTHSSGRINMTGVDDYIAPRPNPLVYLLWSLAAVGLLVLLGWQVKYFLMEKYAQHEDYRRYLTGFCKIAGCELPMRRDPSRFTLTHTRIDLHPRVPDALRVTVKLVNEATFTQPYPDLQLTLADRDGRIVGRRRFPPGDYLKAEQSDMLGSGELGVVLFDLARPHEKAVGFDVKIVKTDHKLR